MLEVEFKASLSGFSMEEIHQKALETGFHQEKHLKEIDVYFNGNDRGWRLHNASMNVTG